MPTVNNRFVKWLLIPIVFFFFACADNGDIKNDDAVLTINDFKMSRQEFQAQCLTEMEYTHTYKTSAKGQQALLDCIIKKELLIQEAKRIGMDKDAKFMAAIEKYWEATLIKLLMEKKNKDIHSTTTVSEHEIQKRYDAYKLKNTTLPPLDEIEKELAAEILEEKKTKTLEKWMDGLRERASIAIDKTLITE